MERSKMILKLELEEEEEKKMSSVLYKLEAFGCLVVIFFFIYLLFS